MKRIILLVAVVAVTAAMLAASSLSGAQEGVPSATGAQYPVEAQPSATDLQYPAEVEYPAATVQTYLCAPWSKEWSLSDGQWVYDWYRWCVDTSLYDPAVESSWEREWGAREVYGQANLCPEKGTCTMSPGGGMKMSTNVP